MEGLHGRVITYKELEKVIPKRDRFLNKELYETVSQNLKKEKNLLFMPTGLWDDKPMQRSKLAKIKNNKSKYKIVLFGILEDGRRASVIINGIRPYFEVKIPDDQILRAYNFSEELVQDLCMDVEDYDRFIEATEGRPSANNSYWKIEPIDFEIVEGKPLKYYQENMSQYVKIYFNKLAHRKDAITYVRSKGFETTHDDMSCYYRVACRDVMLSFASWINLKEFTVQSNGVNDYIKGDVIQVSIKNIETMEKSLEPEVLARRDLPHIKRDNTMTMCWDIETYNSLNDGEVPLPMYMQKVVKQGETEIIETKNPNWNHNIFMIGMTFQFYHSGEQLLRICLVDVPSAPHPDFLTITCGDEQNLIKALAKCYDRMRPEIVMGFNDAGYDWPWIIKRAKYYKGLLKYIGDKFDMVKDDNRTDASVEYAFKSLTIKIEADVNATGSNLQMPGYIPIDVMIVFRQLYPTSEKWNLNFFLSKNKLGSKEDMPYQEMFEIYKKSKELLERSESVDQKEQREDYLNKMALVGKYCVVDAQRCHELMKIRSVLQDKREVSICSYTSMFDAFYRANGMKVRNLVIARAQLKKLHVSNIPNTDIEMGKYPGAWVFPPIKGLSVSKLSIAERVKKANMGYDQFAEWIEKSEQEIKEELEFIKENGCILGEGDVEQLGQVSPSLKKMLEEETGRPITGLDFSSLYPSLIMAYNLSPEYIVLNKQFARQLNDATNEDGTKKHTLHRIEFEFNGRTIKGWSIRHDNKLDESQPDYKFGIFAAILKELFDARTRLKKGSTGLEYWEHRKEALLLMAKTDPVKWVTPEIQEEYEDVCFNYNALDSKQKALKVFMNTFYGEAGNKRSPLFLLQIAGGITTAGQRNIKKAYKYVQSKNCKVYYGDSVPASSPVLLRTSCGTVHIKTIDKVARDTDWRDYPQFKPTEGAPIRVDKQQSPPCVEGLQIWSSSGWTPIKRVIRHRTNKALYRICAGGGSGIVEVTEDHSLLTAQKQIVKPVDLVADTQLLCGFPQEFDRGLSNRTLDPNDVVALLNAPKRQQFEFMRRKWNVCRKTRQFIIHEFSALNAQISYYLMRAIGCEHVYVEIIGDVYQISTYYDEETESVATHRKNCVMELPPTNGDFVYDIETEDGTFLSGVGSVIIKNTDSLYISMPESCFATLDLDYYTEHISKLQYWEEMVKITFKVIKILKDEVNQMFINDNGTEFLKMAYEEVLFPVLFTSKKKYVGIPHISAPNFDDSVPLFIRGLELKKRGVSNILKNICGNILRDAVSVDNILTVMEIVQNKIRQVYATDWTDHFEDFIMTAVYKPNKKNVKVHTFRDRMLTERSIEIKAGERVNYIISKKFPFRYDMRGRKEKLKVGDKMELADVAKTEGIPVDLDYYMENSINGQLARFITYHPDFHVEPSDHTNNEEVKKAEDKILKNAKKFINNFCKEYYEKYEDIGKIRKAIFKKSSNIVSKTILVRYDYDVIVKLLGFSVKVDDEIGSWLLKKIFSTVEKKKENVTYGERYVETRLAKIPRGERKQKISDLQELFYFNRQHNLLKICEQNFETRHAILEVRLRKSLYAVKELFDTNNAVIQKVIEKYDGNAVEPTDEELQSVAKKEVDDHAVALDRSIAEVRFIYINVMSNYEYIFRIRNIVEYLKQLRNKAIRNIKAPKDIAQIIAAMSKEATEEFLKS